MKRLKVLLSSVTVVLFAAMCMFTSCSEKDEVQEYDNWKQRNEQFLDSIVSVAKANVGGNWEVIPAFNLGDSTKFYANHPEYFIYVKKLETSSSSLSPMYVDSVRVHYAGSLIPTAQHPNGYTFNKSYSTDELNENTDVPTIFCVNSNIVGFSTALMRMHEGDRWLVYIPSYLGYGLSEYTSETIPPYSTLIFDIKLARVYRYKIDTNTAWH